MLEELEVDVLLLGEREALLEELVRGLGDGGAALGVEELAEEALAVLRAGIGLGWRREDDAARLAGDRAAC